MTDEQGKCSVNGFRGSYEVKCDGMSAEFVLTKQRDEEEITLK